MAKVQFNTQNNEQSYQFSQGMWSEEPDMVKVQFYTQIDANEY